MAVENGLVTPRLPGRLALDTPAGKVNITYRQEGRFVEEVRLTGVPGFLFAEGLTAEVEGLGEIVADVAYGGNFYAVVEPQRNFRDLADHTAGQMVGWSPKLRAALDAKYTFVHPEHPEICGLSHILWTGAPGIRRPMPATPSSTATRRSTAAPAVWEPRRGWRSSPPRGRSPWATISYTARSSARC